MHPRLPARLDVARQAGVGNPLGHRRSVRASTAPYIAYRQKLSWLRQLGNGMPDSGAIGYACRLPSLESASSHLIRALAFMALAVATLLLFAILDFAIMCGISRSPRLDTFTWAECATVPLTLFLLSGIALRGLGFAVAPQTTFAAMYTTAAVLFFVAIAMRKNGTQNWKSLAPRSILSALVFSIVHFAVATVVAMVLAR